MHFLCLFRFRAAAAASGAFDGARGARCNAQVALEQHWEQTQDSRARIRIGFL
jgi:hypothetical protein